MKFIYSILGIVLGIAILRYSPQILNFFGKDEDAERIFGGGLGGTHFFIKLFGLVVTILSLFFLFGYF